MDQTVFILGSFAIIFSLFGILYRSKQQERSII